jgi:hypothetical protein
MWLRQGNRDVWVGEQGEGGFGRGAAADGDAGAAALFFKTAVFLQQFVGAFGAPGAGGVVGEGLGFFAAQASRIGV